VTAVQTLLIEPFGGMAGDMFLAALLDLADERFTLEDLRALARELVGGECSIVESEVTRGGLAARRLEVLTDESRSAPHRTLADLERLLGAAHLDEAVGERTLAALRRIASAEGAVHRIDPERVHFHEVGAVDTLVDLCGAALALERLGVERVLATPPLTGEGTVACAHGELPVPAPATERILRGLPVERGGGPGERVTPTAAAVLREWVDEFAPAGAFESAAVGYGAGARAVEHGPANLMRVVLGAPPPSQGRTTVWLMECTLDDATGEEIGWCVEGLREAGALEAWTTPVQMKKDRPAVQVCALCRAGDREALERVAFERTPTLGVRWARRERTECERECLTVEVGGHRLRVKARRRPERLGGGTMEERDLKVEDDDLRAAAEAGGVSRRELSRRAVAAALAELSRRPQSRRS
jgi:hypothetical protein